MMGAGHTDHFGNWVSVCASMYLFCLIKALQDSRFLLWISPNSVTMFIMEEDMLAVRCQRSHGEEVKLGQSPFLCLTCYQENVFLQNFTSRKSEYLLQKCFAVNIAWLIMTVIQIRNWRTTYLWIEQWQFVKLCGSENRLVYSTKGKIIIKIPPWHFSDVGQ